MEEKLRENLTDNSGKFEDELLALGEAIDLGREEATQGGGHKELARTAWRRLGRIGRD